MSEWKSCPSCEVAAGHRRPPGGILFEDGCWIMGHALPPILLPGWLILQTRRHVEQIADLNADETALLGPHLVRASHALLKATKARKVMVLSAGMLVAHVHLYLLPVLPGMPEVATAILENLFAGTWEAEEADAVAVAERVQFEFDVYQNALPPPPRMPHEGLHTRSTSPEIPNAGPGKK